MKIAEYNEMMAYLMRPATGDREKLFTGSGDYAKKYLKCILKSWNQYKYH